MFMGFTFPIFMRASINNVDDDDDNIHVHKFFIGPSSLGAEILFDKFSASWESALN